MAALDRDESTPRSAFGFSSAAILPASGLLGLCGVALTRDADTLPTYVWPDVAIVYVLSALPLAVSVNDWVARQKIPAGSTGLGAVGLALSVSLTTLRPLESGVLRAAAALGLVMGAVWFFSALLGRDRWLKPHPSQDQLPALMVVGALLLWLVPMAYVQARCRHDTDRLDELLEQTRLGEARALALRVVALDPSASFHGGSLRQVTQEIEPIVHRLESRVARPLGAGASDDQSLTRARELAILGHSEAALDLLASSPRLSLFPRTCNLRGTIHETLGQWQAAGEAYRMARSAWQERPHSAEREAGLIQATTGIAFCERKLGHSRNAEAAYLERLALAPNADSHFLLAQFYEDAQQTGSARTHARRAMTLAPEKYQQQGEQLLKKLATFHFGCLSNRLP